MARQWRRVPVAFEVHYQTGTREHGAVVWPWTGGRWRAQCSLSGRLVTLRRPRTLDDAKRAAERWLDRRAGAPLKTKGP